jgi:hypothetical protein
MCLLRIYILQFFKTDALIPVNKTSNRDHRDSCHIDSGKATHLFTLLFKKPITWYFISFKKSIMLSLYWLFHSRLGSTYTKPVMGFAVTASLNPS